MPRHKSKSGKKIIAHKDLQQRALELRRDGRTCQQISDALKLSGPGHAYKLVTKAIAEIPAEDAAEVRRVEVARLDDLYSRAVGKADKKALTEGQKIEALSLALRVSERRSKLLGLDAAAKFAVEAAGGLASRPLPEVLAFYRASGKDPAFWPPAVREYALLAGADGGVAGVANRALTDGGQVG